MSNTETFWVNGEPFDLVFTTDPAVPKPNTEKYWYNAQPEQGLLELAPEPYAPPYVPPSPVFSQYGAETYWVNGQPSDQFFPITDTDPPNFAGISTVAVGGVGQLLVTWPLALDVSAPITYQVFIQANTSVALFSQSNVVISTTQSSCSIFALPSGVLLSAGTYFVGVRAVDAFGNSDTNTVFIGRITNGIILPSEDSGPAYEPRAVFSINASNQLQGTIWITKDGQLYNQTLGVASYTVYDKDGMSIGIAQSGILADVNGYFKITPVNANSILDLTHYIVRLVINASGENRVGAVGLTLGE